MSGPLEMGDGVRATGDGGRCPAHWRCQRTVSGPLEMGDGSDGLNNLSFFSRQPAITSALPQIIEPGRTYNPDKTYVAVIIGDGDNIGMVKESRFDWMISRMERCASNLDNPKECFPLVWSISPHLLHL